MDSNESEKLQERRQRSQKRRRRFFVFMLGVLTIGVGASVVAWWVMIRMPGTSPAATEPSLSPEQDHIAASIQADVQTLAIDIGERNLRTIDALAQAADFVDGRFTESGYSVNRQSYEVGGVRCDNLVAERKGGTNPDQIILVGAHYDSAVGTPGANDNASGVAVLLQLAEMVAGLDCERTVRFVAFTNEEPPFFQTQQMGSWVYARHCFENQDDLRAVISLETMGYFRNVPNTQHYPAPLDAFYPSKGNFIGVIGNVGSRHLVRKLVHSLRLNAHVPSEGGALPGSIQGVGWSDHWSFWEFGYPAVMITDTAPFRYPYYHQPQDTPEKLDYAQLTLVTEGMFRAVAELAGASQ